MQQDGSCGVDGTIHTGWSRLLLWSLALGVLLGTLVAPRALYANGSDDGQDSGSGVVLISDTTTDAVIDHSVRPPVRERIAPLDVPVVEVEFTVGPRTVPAGTQTRANYVQVVSMERGRGIPYAPAAPSRGRFTPRERR